MFCRGVCVATAFAVIANGFLLPPDFPRHGEKGGLLNLDPKARSVRLPCPACAFSPDQAGLDASRNDDPWIWSPGDSNDVVLNFRISEDGQSLLLNNEQIYPHVFHGIQSPSSPIFVDAADLSSDVAKPLEITASALRIEQEHSASDEGDVVVPIHYQILALDAQQMRGLPEVAIGVLKTAEGELFILEVERSLRPPTTAAFDGPPPPPHGPFDLHEGPRYHHGCKLWPSFMCKLKHVVDEKWDALRHDEKPGCSKDEMSAHFDDEGEMEYSPPPHHHHHHHPMHHEVPHERPSHIHHIFHTVIRGILGALIPILAGITVGLSVSFMALTLGRAVAWSISRLTGRQSRQRYDSPPLDVDELAEGKILMADDEIDIPPAYENAPAYEDIA